MASLTSCGGTLLLPGVSNVRPRLLGLRRGGEGGFTNAGEASGLTSSVACGAVEEGGAGAG